MYFDINCSTSDLLVAEIQISLYIYPFNFLFHSNKYLFFINTHEIENQTRLIHYNRMYLTTFSLGKSDRSLYLESTNLSNFVNC